MQADVGGWVRRGKATTWQGRLGDHVWWNPLGLVAVERPEMARKDGDFRQPGNFASIMSWEPGAATSG
jgi:hypothetical protein